MVVSRDRPLAPDMLHRWASSFAMTRAAAMLGVAPLKTQSFLCLQMV